MSIENRLVDVEDEVCEECDHCIDGECLGSVNSQDYYDGHYGNECEPPTLKRLLWQYRGVMFHTPEGYYDAPRKKEVKDEDNTKDNP